MHTSGRRDGRAGERTREVSRPPAAGLAAPTKALHASEPDTERVQQARADYRELIETHDMERLKFIDASGINLGMRWAYGRGPFAA